MQKMRLEDGYKVVHNFISKHSREKNSSQNVCSSIWGLMFPKNWVSGPGPKHNFQNPKN